jgi:hypothetical protein
MGWRGDNYFQANASVRILYSGRSCKLRLSAGSKALYIYRFGIRGQKNIGCGESAMHAGVQGEGSKGGRLQKVQDMSLRNYPRHLPAAGSS